ncbi:MAG: 4-(cytidine 5'-diphospho)-2-C-methyl-D-erythritol kinase [Planctomycetota bacterium]
MIFEKTGSHSLKILAPAKLNLFLEVLGKRPDGFHELETIMQTVSLYDELNIHSKGKDIIFHSSGRDAGPPGENLVLKAAHLFRKKAKIRTGFEIHLNKLIPVGAGLGGGSSDCAAVLMGLNRLCESPLTQNDLVTLGGALGSDVPFFFYCGTARCTGRGEIIEPLYDVKPLHFLIFFPGIHLSTPKVYENLNLGLTKRKNDSRLLIALSKNDNESKINKCLFNRLERSALESEPTLAGAMKTLEQKGFSSLRVTGSGSSFFTIQRELDAKGNRSEFLNMGLHWECFLVESSPSVHE